MIAARQIAFGKAAGKKPYDAEIEYLESTGTQYIDTGILHDAPCKYELTLLTSPRTSDTGLMGSRGRTTSNGDFVIGSVNNFFYGFNRPKPRIDSTTFSNDEKEFNIVYEFLEVDKRRFSVNGLLYEGDGAGYNGKTVALFGSGPGVFTSSVKCKSSCIYKNGVLVCDFIPVRVGSVGYMYDKVSGQLFGNQGTGEFVLGPDLIDYTAKDSILDGTVAMWDGVENAGFGKHDASFIGLKDLVGAKDLMLSNNNFLLENGVDFQATQRWQFDTDTIPTEDFTFKVVHDRINTSGNISVFSLGYSSSRLFTANKTQVGFRFGTGCQNADNSDVKSQVVYVKIGSSISMYINGVKINTLAAPYSPAGFTDIAINGENPYGNYRNRITINNIMIVSRAISEDEIVYIYGVDKQRFNLP